MTSLAVSATARAYIRAQALHISRHPSADSSMTPADLADVMRVERTTAAAGDPSARVDVTVRAGSDRYDLFFASDKDVLACTPEALLAFTLLPAMQRGTALDLEGEASAQLLRSVPTLQDIYTTWSVPWRVSLKRIEVLGAVPTSPPVSPTGRVATFFSGGVDSFYTLLKHQSEITDIIFVHGLDIRLDNTTLRTAAAKTVRDVGAELGKTVVELETNLRTFFEAHLRWGYSFGAALAGIAQLLSHRLDRVYVPASVTYNDLFPWGSHPLLDRLWSTERLEVVHDGCEATRVEKVARIAESEIALRTLRVCLMNPGSVYNCGRCEKCIRTMINLRLANALDRCATFAMPLDVDRVRATRMNHVGARELARENLRALRARNMEPALQAALKIAIAPPPPPPRPLRVLAGEFLSHYPRIRRAVRLLRGTA